METGVETYRKGRTGTDAADQGGYIEAIEFDAWLMIARHHHLVVTAVARARDFLSDGWASALAEIKRSPSPPERLVDKRGTVRLVPNPLGFNDNLAAACGQSRSYLAPDPNARRHLLATLEALAKHASSGQHQMHI